MGQNPNDKKNQPDSSFAFDHDKTGTMPSVSRLLNRKTLHLTRTSDGDTKAVNTTIRVSEPTQAEPSQAPVLKRTERRSSKRPALAAWTKASLQGSSDPMAQGLFQLLQSGARGALFMAICNPVPGAPTPTFAASAAVSEDPQQTSLWQGLNWNPAVLPQIWNQFVRSGFVELSPNASGEAQTTRQALGVPDGEILTLIRCGPAQACRGMMAILSGQSLKDAFGKVLPQFSAGTPAKAA
ncbi:MAG: hypothetical protein ACXWP5_13375 [Bdellovibrionota bacterium]